MISCNIDPRYRKLKLEPGLERAAQAALLQQGITESDLTLAITGDAKLKMLNQKFRGEAQSTDVLSFPAHSNLPVTPRAKRGVAPIDLDGSQNYLGDVVISLPRARAQARAAGHPLQAELQLLVVHGLLHLLGHDHAAAADRARMWTAQDAILKELGLSIRSVQAESLTKRDAFHKAS